MTNVYGAWICDFGNGHKYGEPCDCMPSMPLTPPAALSVEGEAKHDGGQLRRIGPSPFDVICEHPAEGEAPAPTPAKVNGFIDGNPARYGQACPRGCEQEGEHAHIPSSAKPDAWGPEAPTPSPAPVTRAPLTSEGGQHEDNRESATATQADRGDEAGTIRGRADGGAGVRPRAAAEVRHDRADECVPEAVPSVRDRSTEDVGPGSPPSPSPASAPSPPLADSLRGDGPCSGCGTLDNIVWFTESVFWNNVIRAEGSRWHKNEPILCINCFVAEADRMGFKPTGWRLLPEWPWRRGETTDVVSATMDALESDATDAQRREAWDRLRDLFYPLPPEVSAPPAQREDADADLASAREALRRISDHCEWEFSRDVSSTVLEKIHDVARGALSGAPPAPVPARHDGVYHLMTCYGFCSGCACECHKPTDLEGLIRDLWNTIMIRVNDRARPLAMDDLRSFASEVSRRVREPLEKERDTYKAKLGDWAAGEAMKQLLGGEGLSYVELEALAAEAERKLSEVTTTLAEKERQLQEAQALHAAHCSNPTCLGPRS